MMTMPTLLIRPENDHNRLQVVDRLARVYTVRKRLGGARIGWNRRWRCSLARTLKSKRNRHQIIAILRKFHLFARN